MNPDFRFDEQRAKQVEAMYKTPDIVAQRREVLRALELRPGERILDVGSGPGLRSLGAEGLYFFSLNRYLFLAVKPGPQPINSQRRLDAGFLDRAKEHPMIPAQGVARHEQGGAWLV